TLPPPSSTLFPYTTLFRSSRAQRSGRRSATPPRTDRTAPEGAVRFLRSAFEVVRRLHVLSHGKLFEPAAGRQVRDAQHEGEYARSEEHTSELQSPDHLVCR